MKSIPYPLPLAYLSERPAFAIFYPIDFLANDDRPLLEGRSYRFKPSIENYKVCPFQDSRHHHEKPMNAAALRSAVSNLDAIKASLFEHISSLHRAGRLETDRLSALWRVTYTAWSMPLQLIMQHRHSAAAQAPIDAATADLSKFCHGILTVVQHVAAQEPHPDIEWSGTSFYRYANEHGLLLGIREVCAASPTMIASIIDFIFHSIEQLQISQLQDATRLNEVKWNNALRFAQARWIIECACIIYEATRVDAALRLENDAQIRQRHSFPYCLSIVNHLRNGNSLAQLFNPLQRINFGSINPEALHIGSMIKHAQVISRSLASSWSYANATKEINEHMLYILRVTNAEIIAACQLDDPPKNFSERDLSLFFGLFPQAEQNQ